MDGSRVDLQVLAERIECAAGEILKPSVNRLRLTQSLGLKSRLLSKFGVWVDVSPSNFEILARRPVSVRGQCISVRD